MIRQPFHLGISTLGCPEQNLPEAAALAERFGFELLELRTLSNNNNLAANLKLPVNAEPFRKLTAEKRISLLGSGFGISDPQANLQELVDLSEIADAFQIPCIRIFGGIPYEHPVDRKAVETARWNLARYRSLGRRCQLALETHDGYSAAAKCMELFQQLGEELPVVWDVHHTVNFGRESFQESYRLLRNSIVEVHLKDSRLVKGKRQSCLPGEGDFPGVEFLSFLAEHAPKMRIIFEYEKFWEPSLPPLESALAALRDNWLKY